MKRLVFVDTAAWLALVNKSDNAHEKARSVRNELVTGRIQFVVTNYVLLEIANALCKARLKETAVKLIDSIERTKDIQVLEIGKEIYKEAWQIYSTYMESISISLAPKIMKWRWTFS